MATQDRKDDDLRQILREEVQRREGKEARTRQQRANEELFQAIEDNNLGWVATCLARGANANARSRYEDTPLFWAAMSSKDPRISEILLDRGADVNARGDFGKTPLHIAARYGREAHLRILLRAGAEIDARDEDGRTPLFCAAIPPRIRALTYLVSRGADVSIRNATGHTPLDVLRIIRGDHALCKNKLLVLPGELADDQWKKLRGLLGGFTTVKLLDIWRDSVIIRVESHHARYTDAVRQAKERGRLAVPTNLVFGRDVPEPGQRIRCGKELSPALEVAWSEARQRRDLGIEPVR